MLSQVKSFLLQNFWDALVHGTYNPYNTLVYAIIFGFLALYVVYPGVKRLGLSFDREFFMAVSPYVLLAGALSAIGSVSSALMFQEPVIAVLMLLLTILALLAGLWLEKRTGLAYHKTVMVAGLIFLGFALSIFSFDDLTSLPLFTGLTVVWAVGGYVILRFVKPDLLNSGFTVPVAAHYLDASTTVAVLSTGGTENQVLAGYFVSLLGPYGIFLLKTLVIVPVVYYILENFEGDERNYYLFLVASLGFALAMRNMLIAFS